jgi:hypothetical protein
MCKPNAPFLKILGAPLGRFQERTEAGFFSTEPFFGLLDAGGLPYFPLDR